MADIFISGIGRQPPRKFEENLIESEKQLNKLRPYRPKFEKYEVIDTKPLFSITLDKNPVFTTLKQEIESFNKEIREAIAENKHIINYHWKIILNQGLRNLLRSVTDTQEIDLQAKFLEKANDWYHDQIQRKEGGPSKDTSPAPRAQSAMTRMAKDEAKTQEKIQKRPMVYGPDPLPSVFKDKTLKDYEDGARSKHESAAPPYDKIKIFDRCLPDETVKPASRQSTRASTRNTTRPQTSKTLYEGVKISTSPFRHKEAEFKPTAVTLADQAARQGGEEQKVGEEIKQAENPEEGEDGAADDQEEGARDAGNEGEKIIIKKMYGSDLMTGYVQHVRNQLLPMEERSAYAFFAPDSDIYEKQLEKRWRDYQHQRVTAKREREEIISYMDEWAHAKGRLDDEISRKNESLKHVSRFQNRAFIPRPQTASLMTNAQFRSASSGRPRTGLPDGRSIPTVGLQTKEKYVPDEHVDLGDGDDYENQDRLNVTEIVERQKTENITVYKEKPRPATALEGGLFDYAKHSALDFKTGQQIQRKRQLSIEEQIQRANIQNFRQLHGELISAKESITVEKAEGRKVHPSLSVYEAREKPKQRPFSAVINKVNPEEMRNSQYEESEEIKKKLARFKINVPISTVVKSVVVPDSIPRLDLLPMPTMGSRLLHNPFAKKKKKKGGKKKKKS